MRARIAQVLGLVDDHHGVVVDIRGRERRSSGVVRIQPLVGGKILVGDQLHGQVVLRLKRPPRPVAQRRRRDHEDTLAPVQRRLTDQFSRQEGFSQPHFVGDEHSVPLVQDAPRPPQPIGLERREMDLRSPFGRRLRR